MFYQAQQEKSLASIWNGTNKLQKSLYKWCDCLVLSYSFNDYKKLVGHLTAQTYLL